MAAFAPVNSMTSLSFASTQSTLTANDLHAPDRTAEPRPVAAAFDPGIGAAMPPKLHLNLATVRPCQPGQMAQILPDGRVFIIQKGEGEDEVRRIDLELNWTRELKGK